MERIWAQKSPWSTNWKTAPLDSGDCLFELKFLTSPRKADTLGAFVFVVKDAQPVESGQPGSPLTPTLILAGLHYVSVTARLILSVPPVGICRLPIRARLVEPCPLS